jgi:hypothetical protein
VPSLGVGYSAATAPSIGKPRTNALMTQRQPIADSPKKYDRRCPIDTGCMNESIESKNCQPVSKSTATPARCAESIGREKPRVSRSALAQPPRAYPSPAVQTLRRIMASLCGSRPFARLRTSDCNEGRAAGTTMPGTHPRRGHLPRGKSIARASSEPIRRAWSQLKLAPCELGSTCES